MLHPELKPSMKDLVKCKEKIDVLAKLTMGEGKDRTKVLRWCQGMVEEIISEGDRTAENPSVVNVMWEGLPHIQGWEEGGLLE
jgi:hypothetical protein